jgi:hypothetical protein
LSWVAQPGKKHKQRGWGTMVWKHVTRFVAVFALVCSPVVCVRLASQPSPLPQAQQDQEAVERVMLSGTVKTPDGVAVPGATVTIVQPQTGQTYVTWTDEKGDFELHSIPVGHYRVQTSQLGFENSTQEFDLSAQQQTKLDLTIKVATMAEITAANQPPAAAKPPAAAGHSSGELTSWAESAGAERAWRTRARRRTRRARRISKRRGTGAGRHAGRNRGGRRSGSERAGQRGERGCGRDGRGLDKHRGKFWAGRIRRRI